MDASEKDDGSLGMYEELHEDCLVGACGSGTLGSNSCGAPATDNCGDLSGVGCTHSCLCLGDRGSGSGLTSTAVVGIGGGTVGSASEFFSTATILQFRRSLDPSTDINGYSDGNT